MKQIKLNTPVPVEPLGLTIAPEDRVMLIGSCFTENMGSRLRDLHFDVCINPFGILYNPLSMAEALGRCLDDRTIGEESLVHYEGLWHSWLHHGSFSNASKEECIEACNTAIHVAHSFLQSCDELILTVGSAWCYKLDASAGEENGKVVVAN